MKVGLIEWIRKLRCSIFAILCVDVSFAADSDRKNLLNWVGGDRIATTGTIYELFCKNLAPKEVSCQRVSLDEFCAKFEIKSCDRIMEGGVNSAGYHVFRVSDNRLLVCFVLFDVSVGKRGAQMIELVAVIPDNRVGKASQVEIANALRPELDKLNTLSISDIERLARGIPAPSVPQRK